MVTTDEIKFKTAGAGDIVDLTRSISKALEKSGIKEGILTVFTPSATSGLTTLEYEPGLLKDLPRFYEKIIPSDSQYHHNETWHDGNGFSHVRSALTGPDITIPVTEGRLTLGTWQQVVFLEFDNQKRNRCVVLKIIGE